MRILLLLSVLTLTSCGRVIDDKNFKDQSDLVKVFILGWDAIELPLVLLSFGIMVFLLQSEYIKK